MMASKRLNKAIGMALLGLAASTLAATGVAADQRTVFDGQTHAPWQLFLGSESNWSVPVWGEETTSHKSEVVVVHLLEEDGNDIVQARWNGGLGQIYWQQSTPSDFTTMMDEGYSISLVARIDERPKKSVDLKMDCGYPCGGALNMTRLFKAVPENQWFRMSFKLSCFEEAGANMANILSPMVVMTKDSFRVSLAEVSLLKNPPAESVVDCG